jgi:hypothetical protein
MLDYGGYSTYRGCTRTMDEVFAGGVSRVHEVDVLIDHAGDRKEAFGIDRMRRVA